MTIIEDVAWEMGVIGVLILGVIVYLEIALFKFSESEYCEINILGSRKPLGGFWIRFADIWVLPLFFSMLKSMESEINNIFGLSEWMIRTIQVVVFLGAIYGLVFVLNYIMKSSMRGYKELRLTDRAIQRRLRLNIVINIVLTFIIISGIIYTENRGLNRAPILMITVIVAEGILLASMKSLEHSVKITDKCIYFPHIKIKWESIIDYEWERNTLILKRKPNYWTDEIKIDINEYDVKELDKYLLKKVLYKKLNVEAKKVG